MVEVCFKIFGRGEEGAWRWEFMYLNYIGCSERRDIGYIFSFFLFRIFNVYISEK